MESEQSVRFPVSVWESRSDQSVSDLFTVRKILTDECSDYLLTSRMDENVL